MFCFEIEWRQSKLDSKYAFLCNSWKVNREFMFILVARRSCCVFFFVEFLYRIRGHRVVICTALAAIFQWDVDIRPRWIVPRAVYRQYFPFESLSIARGVVWCFFFCFPFIDNFAEWFRESGATHSQQNRLSVEIWFGKRRRRRVENFCFFFCLINFKFELKIRHTRKKKCSFPWNGIERMFQLNLTSFNISVEISNRCWFDMWPTHQLEFAC